MSTIALTQCWYTRAHRPAQVPRSLPEGDTAYGQCRHCHRAIFSTDLVNWHIDGGFNMEALGEVKALAFLYLVDVLDDLIVARFPIGDIPDEEGIEALKQKIREEHNLDADDCTLALRDSRHKETGKGKARPRPRKGGTGRLRAV